MVVSNPKRDLSGHHKGRHLGRWCLMLAVVAVTAATALPGADNDGVAYAAKQPAQRLPAAALEWRVFRQRLTPARRLPRGVRAFFESKDASTWRALGTPLFSLARRIVIPAGRDLMLGTHRFYLVPGTESLAIVFVGRTTDGGKVIQSWTAPNYRTARFGQLAGFTMGCTTWDIPTNNCQPPDVGWADFLELVPDGVRTVTVKDVTVRVIDNLVVGTIRPKSAWSAIPKAFDANVARWKMADAKKNATKKTGRGR